MQQTSEQSPQRRRPLSSYAWFAAVSLAVMALHAVRAFGAWRTFNTDGASPAYNFFEFLASSAGVVSLLTLLVSPLILIVLIWAKADLVKIPLLIMLVLVLNVVLTPVSNPWQTEIRLKPLREFAAAPNPVVQAIQDFIQEHGEPPHTLEELVPEYLSAMPSPDFDRRAFYSYGTYPKITYLKPGEWKLSVIVSLSAFGISADILEYAPDTPVEERAYGPIRMGDWIYYYAS